MLAGFRAGAGRSGLLDKHTYYRAVVTRAAFFGALLVGAHVAIAYLLCASSPDSAATWALFASGASMLAFEPLFGRRYRTTWKALLSRT